MRGCPGHPAALPLWAQGVGGGGRGVDLGSARGDVPDSGRGGAGGDGLPGEQNKTLRRFILGETILLPWVALEKLGQNIFHDCSFISAICSTAVDVLVNNCIFFLKKNRFIAGGSIGIFVDSQVCGRIIYVPYLAREQSGNEFLFRILHSRP